MKKISVFLLLILIIKYIYAQYDVHSIPYNPYPYNTGTQIPVISDDTWSGIITLPFTFYFFGTAYNQILVGSNGCISFNTVNAGSYCAWSYTVSCPDPNIISGSTGPFILCPYHDMDPGIQGEIYYSSYGMAPNRIFVISWNQVSMFSCNNLLATQQIILYETNSTINNTIDIYILNAPLCSTWNSGNKCMGIQNSNGTAGLTPPGRNTGPWSATNEGWRFSSDSSIFPVNNYTICADSTILYAGSIYEHYLWSTGDTTQSINVTNSGLYYITVSLNDSVSITDSIDVLLTHPYLNLYLGSDTLLCNTDSIILSAGNGFSVYSWNTGSSLPWISVDQSDNYYVTTLDTAGCRYSDTINVTINPILSFDLGNDTAFCGSSQQIINAGPLFDSYLWSTGDTTSSISVNSAGEYSVTVTYDLCNQSVSDSVSFYYFPVPVANAGSDIQVCRGTSLMLNGSGGMYYQWAPSSGLSDLNISNPVLNTANYNNSVSSITCSLEVTNYYNYSINDSIQCTSIPDNITVYLTPLPPNVKICLVTVEHYDKNVLIWEEPYYPYIDSMEIFKKSLSTGNVWVDIATLSVNDTTFYIDQSSSPSTEYANYIISCKDTCGNTNISTDQYSHRSMFLEVIPLLNCYKLQWNLYEGYQYTYEKIVIYRADYMGSFYPIDTVASIGIGSTYYYDYDVSFDYIYKYFIKALRTNTCYAFYTYNDYVSSVSNIVEAIGAGIGNNNFNYGFYIFPNPANDNLTIEIPGNNYLNSFFTISDICGKQLIQMPINKEKTEINVSCLANGIYFIKLESDNGISIRKFIKQ